jgi:hypothetical protein
MHCLYNVVIFQSKYSNPHRSANLSKVIDSPAPHGRSCHVFGPESVLLNQEARSCGTRKKFRTETVLNFDDLEDIQIWKNETRELHSIPCASTSLDFLWCFVSQ